MLARAEPRASCPRGPSPRPGLPNTSFNESEPIVLRPEEAVDCFLRTEMDVLVLARSVVEKT